MGISRVVVLACALTVIAVLWAGPPREDVEPPQLLILEVDEREIPVVVGCPFTVKLAGKEVLMTLRARDYRVFEAAGIRFRYPQQFTFEYEKNDDVTTWTLRGPRTTLLILRFGKRDPTELLCDTEDSVVQQYRPAEVRRSEVVLATDVEGRIAGRRLEFRLAETALRQDLYAIDTSEGTCVLIVQDTLKDGKATAGTKAMLALLRATLDVVGDPEDEPFR